jgi:signal transduction histidine kinase
MPQTVIGQRGAGGIGGPPSGRFVSNRRWQLQSAIAASSPQSNNQKESAGSEAGSVGRQNEILSAATHDLRGPISAIILFTELLQEEGFGPLNSNQRELIANIHASGELALKLIDDLLDASAIQQRKRLSLQEVDIVSVAQECISIHSAAATLKSVHLTLRHDDNLPEVRADRLKILRVINELLSNAIRVSGPMQNIELGLSARARFLEISVQDQGPGISRDTLKTLFVPFPKEARNRRAGEHGIGLGLAIVKGIVSAHKGRVRVRSRVGSGSTFVVCLPVPNSRTTRGGQAPPGGGSLGETGRPPASVRLDRK